MGVKYNRPGFLFCLALSCCNGSVANIIGAVFQDVSLLRLTLCVHLMSSCSKYNFQCLAGQAASSLLLAQIYPVSCFSALPTAWRPTSQWTDTPFCLPILSVCLSGQLVCLLSCTALKVCSDFGGVSCSSSVAFSEAGTNSPGPILQFCVKKLLLYFWTGVKDFLKELTDEMQRVYLLFGGFSPSNTWQPDPVSDNSPFFTELEGGGGDTLSV